MRRSNGLLAALAAALVLSLPGRAVADPGFYRPLGNFGLSSNDAATPNNVVEADGVLWGSTSEGGSALSMGTIFRIDDGIRRTVYTFGEDGDETGSPGSLILGPDRKLYGTNGTALFSYDPQTAKFAWIPAGAPPQPVGLYAPLISDGRRIFGLAQVGNIDEADCGAIFSYDVVTAKTAEVYEFPGGPSCSNQLTPQAFAYSDGVFYGSMRDSTTFDGAIYAVRAAGGAVRIVHSFAGSGLGVGPFVVRDGTIRGTVYGACCGASAPPGGLYSVRVDGSVFTSLATIGSATRPFTPNALLMDRFGDLFGVSGSPYSNDDQTLFRYGRDGEYRDLHDFTGSAQGWDPTSLVLSTRGMLYGATAMGGSGTSCATEFASQGCGTVFALDPHRRFGNAPIGRRSGATFATHGGL